MVVHALLDGEARFQRYRLHAFVVMPNHVPVPVAPSVTAEHWLGPLRCLTGYRANQLLGRRNIRFWQDESYNHLVRNQEGFRKVQHYIEFNPVRAGLVS